MMYEDKDNSLISIPSNQELSEIQDVSQLFSLLQKKKNILRMEKLNDLMDTILERVQERFDKYPNNFSNKDLVDYMNVIQNTIDKSTKQIEGIDETPNVQLIQNNVTIENDELSKLNIESRKKILSLINNIIEEDNIKNSPIELEGDDANESTTETEQ